jgi:hypothetical protein
VGLSSRTSGHARHTRPLHSLLKAEPLSVTVRRDGRSQHHYSLNPARRILSSSSAFEDSDLVKAKELLRNAVTEHQNIVGVDGHFDTSVHPSSSGASCSSQRCTLPVKMTLLWSSPGPAADNLEKNLPNLWKKVLLPAWGIEPSRKRQAK